LLLAFSLCVAAMCSHAHSGLEGRDCDMGQNGLSRALIAALVGIGIAIGAPSLVGAASPVAWSSIVMFALLLVLCGLLCASVILALVGQICSSRGSSHEDRLYLLADVFLIAAVGMVFVACIFAFVLSIIGVASKPM
jgi:MFS family permease